MVIQIQEATQAVAVARDEYNAAKAAEEEARRVVTQRLNKLNEAEDHLRTVLDDFRRESPAGTDWRRSTDFQQPDR